MVTVEMKVYATGPRRDEVLRTIRWLVRQMKRDAGFEEADLYQSLEGEDKLVLTQSWRTREGLTRFVCSDHFVRLLGVLDLSEKPPELSFDWVSDRQGLEFVEAVRTEESVNP